MSDIGTVDTRASARALIVTKAPIWNNYAVRFGRDVFHDLCDGMPSQKALDEEVS